MFKLLKFVTIPVRYPLRLLTVALLAVAGLVAIGGEVAPIRNAVGGFVGLFQSDSLAAFHPDVASNPAKELELLAALEDEVQPDLVHARALLRKRRADVEYLREISRFLERRIPADEAARLDSAADLDAPGDTGELCSVARAWLTYQTKIRALETELEQLTVLSARVSDLYEKLETRRQETQGLTVEASPTVSVEDPAIRRTAEMSEAEVLLSDVHERLFKALYTLSPELVQPVPTESPAPGGH